jgi:hypothetical protein
MNEQQYYARRHEHGTHLLEAPARVTAERMVRMRGGVEGRVVVGVAR